MKLLIIEDNPLLLDRMHKVLNRRFVAERAGSAHEGLELLFNDTFDIVLLDLGLPDMPGLDVCERIRERYADIPILVISGNIEVPSKVQLLNAGADDYLVKPFDTAELLARIHALIRRKGRNPSQEVLVVENLEINVAKREVKRAGQVVRLRKKEFDILEYLVLNVSRAMPRAMIINHAWPSSNTAWVGSVDVHIKQLREKVDKPFGNPLIKTCYGIGYMIEAPADHVQDT